MVRVARLDELPIIIKMKIQMFEDAGYLDLLKTDAYDSIYLKYFEMYKADQATHFVIEEQGDIVACSGAFIKEDIPYCFYQMDYYGFIGDVYVWPEYRRRGYARRLTESAINWLRNRSVKNIRLLATQEARSLYKSLGFIETDEMILNLK